MGVWLNESRERMDRVTGSTRTGQPEGKTAENDNPSYLSNLREQRGELHRVSTAQRTAQLLRGQIMAGQLPPGERLSEELIGSALDVSRNTLREAFRVLSHERLVVHELNRGVFVRVLDADDVAEIYRMRSLLECGVVREITEPPPGAAAAEAAVRQGEEAARQRRWKEVGTADLRFHQALAAMSGSGRVEDVLQGLHAELRLAFHVMKDPEAFHQPYLARNREILEQIKLGEGLLASDMLAEYFTDARDQLLEQYRHGQD